MIGVLRGFLAVVWIFLFNHLIYFYSLILL